MGIIWSSNWAHFGKQSIIIIPISSARNRTVIRAYFGGKPVTGKIDRLGELDGGSWAVIDYKSEAAAGPEGHAVLTEEYRKSMVI